MAEETIDKAIRAGMLPPAKCRTKNFPFYHNATLLKDDRLKIYGDKAYEIEKITEQDPSTGKKLHPGLPYTKAEIIWICRNEMPVNIEDVLARRTRSLLLDVRASLGIAHEVAEIMAGELGRGKKWIEGQEAEYKKMTVNYL
jgi:glycerol-3-phosphate dehydrogenase